MNHVPMKSNKIVNDPIDNNRASKIRIALNSSFAIFPKIIPNFTFPPPYEILGWQSGGKTEKLILGN